MDNEAGGHRLQRIPPTERKGRVHSSSVTVAVFDGNPVADGGDYAKRLDKDFRIEWYNGTIKAGGQHHQKNATCCRLIHIPTGIVRTSQTRSRKSSHQLAMESLTLELNRLAATGEHQAKNSLRRSQMGSGERSSEKRRTWRFQADEVIDHVTGRRAIASKAIAGHLNPLWGGNRA
jgi:peptide chain release factor 1